MQKVLTSIRNRLHDVEASLKIVKNTLSLLAAGEAFKDLNLEEIFKGPTSLIISEENVVKAAKLAKDFQKEFELFKIKGGLIDGKLFNAEEVLRFASTASKGSPDSTASWSHDESFDRTCNGFGRNLTKPCCCA